MKLAFMVTTGIVTAMLGLGGVENSQTTAELLQGLAVALVGVGIMACAVMMIRQEQA